jgi:uncharacterized protein YdaU (DUF1376 family)
LNYYPWHIGDYLAHTAHLSVIEDCAYRRLLDSYYLTEKALPIDIASCARLIRMREHAAEVEVVLREFFTETPGGWAQERCDAEILKYQDKTVKAKASARASVQSRQATVERTLNERLTNVDTNVELTKNQEPITNTSPKGDGARKRAAASAARPDEVSEPVWQDFQRLRREKRAPLTDTALAGVRREAEKAGVPLEAAIAYCCEAGWQGFNAGWYADRTKGKSTINGGSGREAPHKFAGASAAIYEGVFE